MLQNWRRDLQKFQNFMFFACCGCYLGMDSSVLQLHYGICIVFWPCDPTNNFPECNGARKKAMRTLWFLLQITCFWGHYDFGQNGYEIIVTLGEQCHNGLIQWYIFVKCGIVTLGQWHIKSHSNKGKWNIWVKGAIATRANYIFGLREPRQPWQRTYIWVNCAISTWANDIFGWRVP